ncbi:hypothetical protein FKM82_000795 [Ascaphus truei]
MAYNGVDAEAQRLVPPAVSLQLQHYSHSELARRKRLKTPWEGCQLNNCLAQNKLCNAFHTLRCLAKVIARCSAQSQRPIQFWQNLFVRNI